MGHRGAGVRRGHWGRRDLRGLAGAARSQSRSGRQPKKPLRSLAVHAARNPGIAITQGVSPVARTPRNFLDIGGRQVGHVRHIRRNRSRRRHPLRFRVVQFAAIGFAGPFMGALAGVLPGGHSHHRQNADDQDHNHDLDQRKPSLFELTMNQQPFCYWLPVYPPLGVIKKIDRRP